jgi:hypothetical protein
MIAFRAVAMALYFALALLACESPIVGLQCREGFSLCGDSCVDLSSDFRHCGECDHSCGRFVCEKASCSSQEIRDGGTDAGHMSDAGRDGGRDGGRRDGGRRDGGSLDSGSLDGGSLDGGSLDAGSKDSGPKDARAPDDDAGAFEPDAGLSGCSVGYTDCGGVCANPAVDPKHCGSCNVECPSGQLCSGGSCADECDPALTQCGGACFDLKSDPDHCGQCGKRCTSGICEQGLCADAIAGQAVVLGHDFISANTAMQRLVGNAVFLGLGAPVRVLTYSGDANPASIAGVEGGIDMVKAETGRDWKRTDAIEALVPLQLGAADVFLLHAQVEASNSTLRKLGEQWGNALARFVSIGGVIVVIDAPSDRNSGTFQVLAPARIFLADARAEIASQALTVKTPGLGVAVRVPDRYMSLTHTVHFSGVTSAGTQIVVDRVNLPVVVQRVISPR